MGGVRQLTGLAGNGLERLHRQAVIAGEQMTAGFFLPEALEFVGEIANQGIDQRIGGLKDIRIRVMDERMGGLRVSGEQGEIFPAESAEPIQDGLCVGLPTGLDVLPEFCASFLLLGHGCGNDVRPKVFQPGDIAFIEESSDGCPDRHATIGRIVVLDGAIDEELSERGPGGLEQVAGWGVNQIAQLSDFFSDHFRKDDLEGLVIVRMLHSKRRQGQRVLQDGGLRNCVVTLGRIGQHRLNFVEFVRSQWSGFREDIDGDIVIEGGHDLVRVCAQGVVGNGLVGPVVQEILIVGGFDRGGAIEFDDGEMLQSGFIGIGLFLCECR